MYLVKCLYRAIILIILMIGVISCHHSSLTISAAHQQLFIAPLHQEVGDAYHVMYIDFDSQQLYLGVAKQGSYSWGSFYSFCYDHDRLIFSTDEKQQAWVYFSVDGLLLLEFWDDQRLEFSQVNNEAIKKEFLLELFEI